MRRAALFSLLAVLLVAGCGNDAGGSPVGTAAGAPAPGAQHIHGLGIDPRDGALLIATHSGLFRAGDGSRQAERVGESYQDTMGFTVVGPGRYLGSGHPAASDTSRPPLLGLIRSDDAGESWDDVSLLGEADFHVLRAAGSRIYGVNATDGSLLVSDDGGRSWEQRVPPGEVIDLAAAPEDPDRVVVSSTRGLFASRDGGRRWRPLDRDRGGLLAWPAGEELHLVDGAGTVHRSGDGGATWRKAGESGAPPAAFLAHDDALYVATPAHEVLVSRDGGRSWELRVSA